MYATTDISYDATDNNAESQLTSRTEGGGMRTPAASSARRRKARKSPRKSPGKAKVVSLTPENEVSAYISAWSPKPGAIREQWSVIAATVRSVVIASQPGSTRVAARHLLALARHTATRHMNGMSITNTTELLSDTALASTLGAQVTIDLSENSRRTELSFLRRLRARALPDEYGQPKELTKLSGSPIAQPFPEEELAAMLAWCRNSGHRKAPQLHAAILLSVACGIDGSEMPRVMGTDVLLTGEGLILQAPGMRKGLTRPARAIPIRGAYEKELALLARAAADQPLIGVTNDLNTLTTGTEKTQSVPKFHAGRGRVTWTRELLIAGATVVALRQAGVSTRGTGPLHELSLDLHIAMPEYVSMLRASDTIFDPQDHAFAGLSLWSQP